MIITWATITSAALAWGQALIAVVDIGALTHALLPRPICCFFSCHHCRHTHTYTGQLLARDLQIHQGPHSTRECLTGNAQRSISGALSSPLRPDNWDNALATMPDRLFVHFLIRGIRWGFRIGVTAGASYKAAARNLKSAYDRPDIISAYLQREVELGRLHALPSLPHLSPPLLQISPFGAIPKKDKPDKWRLIVDLSSPKGYSVNDAIASEQCSVSYTSVDRAVDFVRHLGEGCLLAKLDLKEAYRAVPVHPSDQRLLHHISG